MILTAPAFFCMPSDKRKAIATNERSAHAPKTLGEYKASHGPGAVAVQPEEEAGAADDQDASGAKGFPTARPWMISH